MIIDEISVQKFRGFENVNFKLGQNLTVIAGQNGTQKTTILGMLSQPFSITKKENPIFGEKPLCGGNYKSSFAEKFKLSETFDKPKCHEWSLRLNGEEEDFTVESISRKEPGKKDTLRFWKKGDRSSGAGYIQIPVIFLSLSRLLPIGEDSKLDSSSEISLSKSEQEWFQDAHNRILCVPNLEITDVNYLESSQKNTLGVSTEYYDWKSNSAGQDNIGKILLAILSFKRLKEKYHDEYSAGILAIDEIDATLYPASQIKLIEMLRKFSSQFNIQIILTTHSLGILEETCKIQASPEQSVGVRVVFLERKDNNVYAVEGLDYNAIQHRLNITLKLKEKTRKVPTYLEDKEAEEFLKAILKGKASKLAIQPCSIGCKEFIGLAKRRIPSFTYPNSLIVLDGDVLPKEVQGFKNFLLLPSGGSPEQLLSAFLYSLPEISDVWGKIYDDYTKAFAFKNFTYREIQGDRQKAKRWYNEQKGYWGRASRRMINVWIECNSDAVQSFIDDFDKLYKEYEKSLAI